MSAERRRSKGWWLLAALLVAGAGVVVACRSENGSPNGKDSAKVDPDDEKYPPVLRGLSADVKKNLVRNAAGEPLTDLYKDMTAQSGISFSYRNGQEANHF